MAVKKYEASNITWLKGLAGVAAKPGMYVGETDARGVLHCAKEIIGNCLDEATNGHGTRIAVSYIGKVFTVYDEGRGIPVGKHPDDPTMDSMTIVATQLHAGGKIDSKDGNYGTSIGCFTGGTKIKLLSGRSVRIDTLAKNFKRTGKKRWVFAFNKDSNLAFVPRRAYGVFATRLTSALTEVVLDTGAKILCTPDHPFMLWGGKYIQASKMTPGLSLQAVHFAKDKDGYLTHSGGVRQCKKAGSHLYRVNRTVAKSMGLDITGKDVSHINANKIDNRPPNLQACTTKEHWWFDHEKHGKNETFVNRTDVERNRSRRTMRRLNREGIQNDTLMGRYAQNSARALRDYGVVNEETYNACRPWCGPRYFKAVAGVGSERELRKLASSYLRRYGNEGKTSNGGQGLNYKLQSEYRKSPAHNANNHSVVSVRTFKTKNPVQVYGMSVEEDHNYMLDAGVFVKNSHGVGLAVVNALSLKMTIWSYRNNKWNSQTFAKGVPTSKVTASGPPPKFNGKSWKSGTVVQWEIDLTCFDKGTKFAPSALINWIREISWFVSAKKGTKSIPVIFDYDVNGKVGTIQATDLKRYVRNRVKKLENTTEIMEDTFMVDRTDKCDFVGAWTTSADQHFASAANAVTTVFGGTHEKGALKAMEDAFRKIAKKTQVFKQADLMTGFVGCFNIRIPSPKFDSQSKTRLTSPGAEKLAYDAVLDVVTRWIRKNKVSANTILERAIAINSISADSKLAKQLAAALRTKKGGKSMLPAKLVVSTTKKPEERELFLVEGDSAGGTGKKASDRRYQEVLPMRGKILNVEKANKGKMQGSQAIIDILQSIGYDPKNPEGPLRVGRIMILADPDPDGPLHGDTLVPVVGRGNMTIREMAEEYKVLNQPFRVYARGELGIITEAEAVQVTSRTIDKYSYIITTDDGGVSRCSVDHKWPVLNTIADTEGARYQTSTLSPVTKMRYVVSPYLQVGDQIPTEDGLFVTVTSSVRTEGEYLDYYCMTVPLFENFLIYNGVQNIVTSNCHINALCLSVLWKVIPHAFKQGLIYVVNAPLFIYSTVSEKFYGSDLRSLMAQVKGKFDPSRVTRIKGYGEASSKDLREIAFNPTTRKLTKVLHPGAKAIEVANALGTDMSFRRKLLGFDG